MNPMTFEAPISPSVSSVAPLFVVLSWSWLNSFSVPEVCTAHGLVPGALDGVPVGRTEAWCLELLRGAFGALLLTFGNGEETLELPMVTKTWNPNLRQEEPEFQASLGHGEKR